MRAIAWRSNWPRRGEGASRSVSSVAKGGAAVTQTEISRPESVAAERGDVLARFCAVRAQTEALAAPLTPEDQIVQSMPDASPTKWHLAHVTWFFEHFVLEA